MAGLAPEPPEKINYRSVGRGDGGCSRKPRPRYYWDPDYPTVSSIPTQFETKLYRNNRERAGFTSQTPRFDLPSRKGAPGPGSYNDEEGGARPKGGDSVGERGSGAFASRKPRFAARPGNGILVGPGDYETQHPSSPSRTGRNGAPQPTPSFVQPASSNPQSWGARPSPGPGDYLGPEHACSARGQIKRPAAFFTKEGAKGSASTAAADDATPPRPVSAPRSSTVAPASRSGRTLMPADEAGAPAPASARRPPPASAATSAPPARPPPKAIADRAAELSDGAKLRLGEKLLRAGWEPQQPLAPGPGDYEPQFDAVKGRTHFSQLGSSSFQLGTSHHARKWRPGNPGPGDYETALPPSSPKNGAAPETFATTPRFTKQVGVAPGPAYYAPKPKEPHRSFHLNIQNHWV